MFAGGCTLQTAEAVCGMTLERLGAFVDHSLLRRTVGESGSRYHMLETIREHAAEQLTADDAAHQVRRRHAEHFLAVAESANLIEDAEAAGEQHHEIVIAEQDNMRAALQWTLDTGEIEFGLQLALTLENYWVTSAPFEGMRWFEALLPLADHVPKRLHARAVRCYGGATTMTGADLNGERLYEQSLAEFRALGDEAAVGSLLQRLAESARQRGDAAHARRLAEESLQIARSTGATRVEAQSLGTLGSLTYEGGDYELGMQLLERSADLCAEIGFRWWQGLMLAFLCENALSSAGPARPKPGVVRRCDCCTRSGTGRTLCVCSPLSREPPPKPGGPSTPAGSGVRSRPRRSARRWAGGSCIASNTRHLCSPAQTPSSSRAASRAAHSRWTRRFATR